MTTSSPTSKLFSRRRLCPAWSWSKVPPVATFEYFVSDIAPSRSRGGSEIIIAPVEARWRSPDAGSGAVCEGGEACAGDARVDTRERLGAPDLPGDSDQHRGGDSQEGRPARLPHGDRDQRRHGALRPPGGRPDEDRQRGRGEDRLRGALRRLHRGHRGDGHGEPRVPAPHGDDEEGAGGRHRRGQEGPEDGRDREGDRGGRAPGGLQDDKQPERPHARAVHGPRREEHPQRLRAQPARC